MPRVTREGIATLTSPSLCAVRASFSGGWPPQTTRIWKRAEGGDGGYNCEHILKEHTGEVGGNPAHSLSHDLSFLCTVFLRALSFPCSVLSLCCTSLVSSSPCIALPSHCIVLPWRCPSPALSFRLHFCCARCKRDRRHRRTTDAPLGVALLPTGAHTGTHMGCTSVMPLLVCMRAGEDHQRARD